MKNGQVISIKTAIRNIDLTIVQDKNGVDRQILTVEAYDNCGKTDNDGNATVWLSPKQLNRMATKLGFASAEALATAINTSFDDSYLTFDMMFCKAGEPILDDNGEPIAEGGVYGENDWFKTMRLTYGIELAESALDYLAEINKELDKEDARAARDARAKQIARTKSSKGVRAVVKQQVEETEEEEEEEDEDVQGAFGGGSTELTKAEMKAANKAAKAAGKPEPYTVAQVNAGK